MTSRYVTLAAFALYTAFACVSYYYSLFGVFGRVITRTSPSDCLPIPFLYRLFFSDPYYRDITIDWQPLDVVLRGIFPTEHPYYRWTVGHLVPYFDFTVVSKTIFPYWSYYNWKFCNVYTTRDTQIALLLSIIVWWILLFINFLYWNVYIRNFLWSRALFICSGRLFEDFRSLFRRVTMENYRPKRYVAHSHPEAAANRSIANDMIDNLCNLMKLKRYDHSKSSSGKYQGSRNWFFAKDLRSDVEFSNIPSKCLETMIDVDYYPYLPDYLTGRNCLCLYTFVPETCAGRDNNSSYWFDENGEVHCLVDGGAEYQHKLWDFSADDLTVDHWWGSSVYVVENFRCGPNRRLIFLNPVRNVYGPLAWLIPGKRLLRWDVVKDGVARIRNKNGYSLARAGQRVSIELSERTVVTTLTRLSSSKTPHMSDVERIFRTENIDNYVGAAAVFYDVWKDLIDSKITLSVARQDQHSYQSVGPLAFEDGTASMRSLVVEPMMSGYAPVRSYNNDEACIFGRITSVRNTSACPKECYGYEDELLKLICNEVGVFQKLEPLDYESLRDRLRNASNLAKRMDSSEVLIPPADRVTVSSFQKGEAYPKIAPPRNISTLPVGHNFRLGQFTYPAGEMLKLLDFYGPGKHPKELADRVVEVARDSLFLNNTDVSKMDGSSSQYLAEFYLHLLLALYRPEYHLEIRELFTAENLAKAFTSEGVCYDILYTIASGSSATSQRGSCANILMAYSALRRTGYNPEQAFGSLGIYFGDDGMTPNVPANVMERTCARHGVLVKAEIIQPGEQLVFLGRCFLNPFHSPVTIADVPRQLRKLHLTDSPISVPRGIILRRRAMALLITDPKTPILSHWANAIMRLTEDDPEVSPHIHTLAAREDSYWLRFEHPFHIPDMEEALPCVSNMMSMPAGEIMDICIAIDAASTIEDAFYNISRDMKVEIAAVIDGVVVEPTDPPQHRDKLDAAASKSIRYCRDFQKGICKREKCKFDHIKEKENVCRDFLAGKCKRVKCKFTH